MVDVSQPTPLRVLEFYSGIGGMRFALEEAGVSAVVVEAFEINDIANDVYEHNFGHRPSQGNIQHLTVQQLDNYKADVWLLSPPCQPYTRQGLQKDAEDSRAFSFLKMLDMLPHMSRPPTHLFVENVVGFECSVSHGRLIKVLEGAGFLTQEFVLTPLQFGIPYSRPRYFCLAKKISLPFLYPQFNRQLLYRPGPIIPSFVLQEGNALNANGIHEYEPKKLQDPELDPVISCRPIREYLEPGMFNVDETVNNVDTEYLKEEKDMEFSDGLSIYSNDDLNEDCSAPAGIKEQDFTRPTSVNEDIEKASWLPYEVPDTLIERWGDAFDVVTPDSRRCCCFTKSYGRFVKGTGSFLATKKAFENGFKDSTNEIRGPTVLKVKSYLRRLGLRYFTPREIANLHSFPQEFNLPDHVSLKQRYALLGNSLSVAVVAPLLRYLLSTGSNGDIYKLRQIPLDVCHTTALKGYSTQE